MFELQNVTIRGTYGEEKMERLKEQMCTIQGGGGLYALGVVTGKQIRALLVEVRELQVPAIL